MSGVDPLARELRHAIRSLRRAPTFTAAAVATLALALAATAAIYAVLESVVLRPLPYRDPDRLVAVLHPTTLPGSGEGKWGMSAGGYFQFRALARTLEDLGGYTTGTGTLVGDDAEPEAVRVAEVTATVFTTLRARPHLGTLLTAAEDAPGAPLTAVLSYELWRRRFGADAGVVGRTVRLGGTPYRVVGVAEPGLTLPMPGPFASTADLAGFGVDLWTPLRLDPAGPFWNSHQYTGIGRLRPGVTPEQARAELAAITARLPELVPNAYSARFLRGVNFRVGVTPLAREVLGPVVARALWMLFGAVGLVLLIAGANVATLFLARAEARGRETAIRAALGADRARRAAHALAESLLLALGAGVLGVLLARWALPALLAAAPRSIPRLAGVELRWTAALLALALAAAAGLAFGLVGVARRDPDVGALREGGRGLAGSRRQRAARGALVVAQVALAVVLLACAGLLVRSVARLRSVDPGLDPRGVLTFRITLPFPEYGTVEAAVAFHQQLSERLAALPGVVAVGAADRLPLQDYGAGCTGVQRERRADVAGEQGACVPTPTFTPGYFAAMGIAVRGRAPDWRDVGARTQAAVVTRALAERLWPGEDPIGQGIVAGDRGRGFYRVAGVVPELRAAGLDRPPTEALFVPATMLGPPPNRSGRLNTLVYSVRTTRGDPLDLVPSVQRALRAMHPQVPLVDPRTMQTVADRSVARTSFVMLLLTLAAGMALALSAVGLYGVVAYLVAQQRSEIGVRMALGARTGQVGAMVVLRSLRLAALGAAVGLAGAVAGTRLLRALLFEVSPTDPVVLAAVPLLLLAVAAAASLAPARRAAAVDPVEAMRG